MTAPVGSDVKIRPAGESDRTAIARLHALSWQDAYRQVLPDSFLDARVYDNRLEKWQRQEILPRDLVLVAERKTSEENDSGEIQGFVAVWCRPDPFIDNLHVRPGFRARGLGTSLMQAAARELVRMGHTTAWLWAVTSNTRAIRFYERLGGVCTGRGIVDIAGTPVENLRMAWADLRAFPNVL